MDRYRCVDILAGRAPADTPIVLEGWVRTRRDSKAGVSFLHVSDGSCFQPVQAVVPNTLANYATEVQRLTAGCAVAVTGNVVPSPAKGQPFEMQATELRVVGWVDDPETYPIQPKPHTLEFLREVAHLRPRTNVIGACARVRHALAQAIHRFFHEDGFLWVNTPIITASDTEGAGELFRVSTLDLMNVPKSPDGRVDFAQDFFGRETFLTVSGQLNVETYRLALSKVYTFGPTFRAENSNTSRHLAEFWMIEPEIAFADLSDNATLAERLLKYVLKAVLDRHLWVDLERVSPLPGGDTTDGLPADFEQHYFTLREDARHHDRLRRICAFDLITNNADRKSGHCLLAEDGTIYAIDNGLCFHVEPKLRTVIWEFADEALPPSIAEDLERLLAEGLPASVRELIAARECAVLLKRARGLVKAGRFPVDTIGRGYPWPLV